MKKIVIGYIFNENNLTKDERLFLETAEKENIELVLFNTAKDIDEEDIKKKAKNCRIFYNNSAEEFSLEIVKTLETLGKKVVDSSRKNYYDEDKWMFFLKCERHKIPTLRTILLSETIPTAKKELEKFNSWPVVLKRVIGTMGQYVDKAENIKQAEKIIRKFWKKGSERLPIIAQEFVKSPSYRVTIIDGKIVQTAIKKSKGWKATGVYAKHFKKFKVDTELKKITKKITKTFNIKVCGIDLLKKKGKWLVLEINSTPAFDFFVQERKKLIKKVLDFLKRRIK
ncbi:MAG: ATP-grasp domain-containing protein [Candidatus Pacearchaeota archaeon]|nr:ATP-grasp domain-containing protein [Candidatus Pacearchaeota archaeon]